MLEFTIRLLSSLIWVNTVYLGLFWRANSVSNFRIFMVDSQSELSLPITWNSVESDLRCTSRIYFENVTLTLHNLTLTSQKPCQYNSKFDCSKQHSTRCYKKFKFFSIKYCYSDILLKKQNFIYSVDRIMDFNRLDPTCYRTYFPYAFSG